jgi:acylphosphatase
MHTEHSLQRLEARITGRVQGVGYRHFIVRQAQRLAVSGWVRNERDGSVFVVAEGEIAALEALLEVLGGGPDGARVHNVLADWGEAKGELDGFTVRF